MKLKIHWGLSITVFLILFVLFLLGNLIFSATQSNDLVTEDYYQKEVDYQRQIDKEAKSKRLPGQISIIKGAATLAFQFPSLAGIDSVNGEIHFYRPSNKKMDKKIQIKINDDRTQVVDIREFVKGFWKIKIDWAIGDSAYYHEESLFL